MKDFISRLKINAAIAVIIVFSIGCITLAWWWYTVPSDVLATIYILSVAMLTVLITAVRELFRAYERTLPKKHKKIRMRYDSHGMHTDNQRLGYVSAETIREVCRKGAKQ